MFRRVGRSVFRLDTRIYLADLPAHRDDGQCVGAVVGKNPGSARGTRLNVWEPLVLGNDKMLPYVRNRFLAAYERNGTRIPQFAFVQVSNLFYLCNENLSAGCREYAEINTPLRCHTECTRPQITWFVWGGSDNRLDCLKERFLRRRLRNPFYFDKYASCIVRELPTSFAFAKHTQGLASAEIEKLLAKLLCTPVQGQRRGTRTLPWLGRRNTRTSELRG
jgi:hypothetical protein